MGRDGGCRFPGCTQRRFVEAPPVQHWTKGGLTDLANLILLCWRHHHAVHEGGYRMTFEHGVVTVWRPDGSLLQSESLLAEGPGIVEQNKALGFQITPESVASQWDGTQLTSEICLTPSPGCCGSRTATAATWRRRTRPRRQPSPGRRTTPIIPMSLSSTTTATTKSLQSSSLTDLQEVRSEDPVSSRVLRLDNTAGHPSIHCIALG